MTNSPKPTGGNIPTEAAAGTVARIEAIRAEDRTKEQNRALGRAKAAVREEERKRPRGQTVEAPPPASARAGAGARDARSVPASDAPVDRLAMAETVLRELHASLGELSAYAPKDRASILSLCAKLSGMLDAKPGEAPPFLFRGFEVPEVRIPTGAEPWTCPACAHVHRPGGPVPEGATVAETTLGDVASSGEPR